MTINDDVTIVPRWEWRTFAASLKGIENRLPALAGVAPRASSEVYFLRLGGQQNAKIRDDAFDVKRLRQVDAKGLELWQPVFKAEFPLDRSDVAAAFAEWRLPLPKLTGDSYTIGRFLGELIAAQPAIRVAHVAKSRRGFRFAGCIAEFVQLSVEASHRESFSLEHEEPARIVDALRILGLETVANTNYPLGLKQALGLENGPRQHDQTGAAHA